MTARIAIYGGKSLLEEIERELSGSDWERVGHDAAVAVVALTRSASNLDVLAEELRTARHSQWILVLPQHSADAAAAAVRAGFHEYLRRPLAEADLGAALRRCFDRIGAAASPSPESAWPLVGGGPRMQQVRSQILDVAAAECNVLVTGETGTGKELVAELIHSHSSRRAGPLVCVNCAAVPDSLWESELFGYERGAFTGAQTRKAGTLEAASGGTVFLDEVGEMSAAAQAKMLRAIETRQACRLGGNTLVALRIRVVAATNRDLNDLVSRGEFRRDLYFRLGVARIHLPPLRERREDVSALLGHYVTECNRKFGRSAEGFTEETLKLFSSHDWPGNVRELRNVVEACYVHLPFARMRFLELPPEYRSQLAEAQERFTSEIDRLRLTLDATNWNISQSAKALRWSRMTIYRKLAKYHLEKRSPSARKAGV